MSKTNRKKSPLVPESLAEVAKLNAVSLSALVVCILISVAASLLPPQLLRIAIDTNFTQKTTEGLLAISFGYLGAFVAVGVFELVKATLLTRLGQQIMLEIRSRMMQKLSRVSSAYLLQNDSGVIVSRFTNDVDTVGSLFTSGVVGMVIDCFKIAGIIGSVWLFSARLALLVVLFVPIVYFITRTFQRSVRKAQMQSRILVGKVSHHIRESLLNMRIIKLFAKEEYLQQRYQKLLEQEYDAMAKVNFFDSIYSPTVQMLRSVAVALIVLFSVGQGGMLGLSIGMVAASIDLVTSLFLPIETLGTELQNIQSAMAGIERVNELYEAEEDIPKDEALTAEALLNGSRELVLKDLSFAYEDNNFVLQNISCTVSPKSHVAFVGRTGVGKSTLFKLILGLLPPDSGSVTFSGANMYALPNIEKRRLVGYVEQTFRPVGGSVADQISLKDKQIGRADIVRAVMFVNLMEYIETLPKGLDTEMTDGLFSQGQKQLLNIARAIVCNPCVLLLDEITASLDSVTEQQVLSVLERAGEERTILSISHRVSSLKGSDRVLLIEKGRLKREGTPAEMMTQDNWYHRQYEKEALVWEK